jgi:lipoic acid synthetase
MGGLGETDKEIYKTLDDLAMVGCNIVTIGQYLRPSMNHAEVKRCVKPEIFEGYKRYGESIGIGHVFSGPLVRSSYMAENVFNSLLIDGRDHG